MTRALFASALLCGAASWAQTLSVVSAGKLADPWASQLEARVCAQADCVPAEQVTTKKKVDWKKAAKANVGFVVRVEAAKQKAATVLTIEVMKGAGNVLANKVLMINSQTISAKNLDAITSTLWRTTGITPRPLAEEPKQDEPVTAKDEPKPDAPKKDEPAKVEPMGPVSSSDGTGPVATVTTTAPEETAARASPFLTVDVGLEMDNRSFEYAGFRSRELRAYNIPFFPSVALAAELSPFRGMDGFVKTLSFEVSGAMAPWLTTATSATETVGTFRGRLDAGGVYRFPVGGGPLTMLVRVGFHTQAFTLATPVVGLPNAVYLGVRAGAGAEVRFLERLTAFVHANALPMFSSRDLVSSSYFARGANVGLEVRGGLVVHLAGPLSVRANVEWTRYFFLLDTTVVQDSFAQGAVDQYLGFQLAARVSF